MAKISLKEIRLFIFPSKQVDLAFLELSSSLFVTANTTHAPGLTAMANKEI